MTSAAASRFALGHQCGFGFRRDYSSNNGKLIKQELTGIVLDGVRDVTGDSAILI